MWLDLIYLIIYSIIGLFALGLLVNIIEMYNELVGARNEVKNAWAQIDVQLKRRIDLIPNLLETVKGYAKHEKGVFEEVTEARSGLMNAGSVKEVETANNQLTGALKTLFAVAENYPDLKASSNFQDLQNKLSETEDKIAYSRQFYNDTVLMYNNQCQMFPSNIMASLFNFNEADFFEAVESDRTTPFVKF